MRKLLWIIVIMIGTLCFAACSSEEENAEGCDLNGVGLEELLQIDVPEGFEPERNEVRNENGGELISKFYGKGDTSIYTIILSYRGKAVMGSDETMEEWYEENKDIIAESVPIENADSDAFLYPIGVNTKASTTGEESVIEAVFAYHDYLIMVGMDNNESGPLTEEQKTIFNSVLQSIRFVD